MMNAALGGKPYAGNSLLRGMVGLMGVGAVLTLFADGPFYRDWIAADGYANSPANWSDGVLPASTEAPRFNGSGSYTVRFPSGGYTLPGKFTTVRELVDGGTVTFDATEGDWLQQSDFYESSWQAFMVCANNGGSWPHILNVTGATGGKPLFRLSGGKVRFTRNASSGSVLELLDGTWNFYDPTGTPNTTHGLALVNAILADSGSKVILQPGSSLRAANLYVDGGTPNSRVVVNGGEHKIWNAIQIGRNDPASLGSDYLPTLQVSGGSVELMSGRFSIASRSNYSAQLLLDGTGRVAISNESLSLAAASASTGIVSLADDSEIHVASNLLMSSHAQCKSILSLAGSSAVTVENEILVGDGSGSESEIALSGSSRLVQNLAADVIRLSRSSGAKSRLGLGGESSAVLAGLLTLGGTADAESTVVISNNASLTVTHPTGISIGRYSRSKGLLRMQDNARLYLPNATTSGNGGICLSGSNNQWGNNMSAESRLVMEGGLIDAPDGLLILCGTNSFVTLAGGETRFSKWNIRGDANTISSEGWVAPTNTILVTGGNHTVGSSSGSEFLVGDSGTMACLDVRGGTVTAFGVMNVGVNATGSGCAVFSLSGTGRVVMNRKSNAAVVSVANAASASARAELKGGELVTSSIKGGAGTSELFADGAKMTLNGTDSTAAIYGFTTAELGAGGLTLDTDGFDSAVTQSFADASGAAGLFTKSGKGTLTATAASGHARTRVAGGTLATANAFGRSIEVAAGATLDITGATGLTFENVVLGMAAASQGATVAGDWASPIAVSGTLSIAGKTGLLLADATTARTIELFRVSGTFDLGELANLEVVNVSSAHGYEFTATDDNGTTVVSLAISAVEVTDNTWTGAEGSAWATENFTSAPTSLHRYVFPSDAATKSVTVPAGGATARGLSVAGDYSFQGGTLALMDGISVTSGSATLGNSIDLKGNQVFDVAADTTLALNGPLSSQTIGVTRTGNGAFVLGAANADFYGSWSLAGGFHRFADGAAFGAVGDTPVTLVSGTLQYSGATPGTLSRPLVVAGASDQSRVVIDAGVGLMLSNGFNSTHGGLVKTGAGTLEIVCPEGTIALGTGNANNGDGAVSSVPDNGTSPSGSSSGATAGLDILDGTLRITGAGKDKTTVSQTQKTWIGTGYSGQSAPVALEIEDVKYIQGGASRQLVVGGGVAPGCDDVPTLRVNNSALSGNTLQFGNGTAFSYPTVAVTNSTVELIYEITIGQASDNVHPVLRIGAGGIVRQSRPTGSATGIVLNRNVDVEVSGGGVLETIKGTGETNCGVKFNSGAFGRMRFTDGGRLRTYMFTVANSPTEEKHMSLEFDGGVLEMTGDGVTSLGSSEYQVFTVGENGMEVAIGDGVSHGFATPFTGAGAVVKTGAGAMKLLPSEVPLHDMIEADGGLEVREGVVDLGGGTISVSAIRGGGTVTNGTLTGVIVARPGDEGVLTLGENLTAGSGVKVNVQADDPADLSRGDVIRVAVVDGATVDVSAWRCRVANSELRGECSLVGNTVYVTLKPRQGLTLIIK